MDFEDSNENQLKIVNLFPFNQDLANAPKLSGLSMLESMVIHAYFTGNFMNNIQPKLWAKMPLTKEESYCVEILLNILSKRPQMNNTTLTRSDFNTKGDSLKSLKLKLCDNLENDGNSKNLGFWSTSIKAIEGVTEEDFYIEIHTSENSQARDVFNFSKDYNGEDESEVLFPPQVSFKIINRAGNIFVLKEFTLDT